LEFEGIITAKREYYGDLTHLKVHPVRDGEAQAPEARTKESVIEDIVTRDCVYYTARPDGDSMTLKSRLRVVESGTKRFLRTDQETTPEDVLHDLPNF
jgi:hypothetical protein